MSLKQTHFKQTPEPLFIAPGELLIAECGEAIPDATWHFGIAGDIGGSNLKSIIEELRSMNSLQFCQKCLRSEFTQRYLSGIRSRSKSDEAAVEESA